MVLSINRISELTSDVSSARPVLCDKSNCMPLIALPLHVDMHDKM